MPQLLTEFIGRFFLVPATCSSVALGSAVALLAIGGTPVAMVYMGGHASGAHYNPAITLALAMRGAARSVIW